MSTSPDATPSDNVRSALRVSEALSKGDAELAAEVFDPAFKQHNLQSEDGIAGFRAFVASLGAGGGGVSVVRVLEDGPFVITHAEGDVFGPKVMFDIYRFADGRIVEHWDNLTERKPPNPSGRTATDGPREPRDRERTDANKALVAEFFQTVFVEGRLDEADRFHDGDALIQHNPGIADGLANMKAEMRDRAAHGRSFEDGRIEHVYGEGNFVLLTVSGRVAGKSTAIYELFRVEDGKIAEHWDAPQEIPPESERRNANGKF